MIQLNMAEGSTTNVFIWSNVDPPTTLTSDTQQTKVLGIQLNPIGWQRIGHVQDKNL